MLRHLHISNFALIEEITLDLGPGLTVLTGETGAGKSLVLDAIGLLGGGRAAPALLRAGADRAVIEALFDVPLESRAARRLAELGLETEEGEAILRRELLASGRHRASINGRLVPQAQLGEMAALLIDLGTQNEQQRLLQASAQRDFFDSFAGLAAQRAAVAERYRALREAAERLEALRGDDRERAQRQDFVRFQVEELDALGAQPGELEDLEAECSRLDHVEELRTQAAGALAALSEPADDATTPALDLVGVALSAVEEMAAHDPTLARVREALVEAQDRLAEAVQDISRYADGLETDPERLNEINERISALRSALKKYGPTEQDMAERLTALRAELETLVNWDSELASAEKLVYTARQALLEAGKELARAREKAKGRFTRSLATILRDFSMPKVQLDVSFRPVSSGICIDDEGTLCGLAGLHEVEVLFSANEGEALQPLRKIASGGELSRMMLAIRTLAAAGADTPLLVFDEVDAGISGTAARCVAQRLAALGERSQILAVTHNPSVASAANCHLIVEKREDKGRTNSVVYQAEGIKRQSELARLLDGGRNSAKGMALAAELLEVG